MRRTTGETERRRFFRIEDQELLIQFIVRPQGQFLQRLREQRESTTAQLLS